MSKNTIIGVVIGLIVIALVVFAFVLPGTNPEENGETNPEENGETNVLDEDLPIMELSEEELTSLTNIRNEALPEGARVDEEGNIEDESYEEEVNKLQEKVLQLTADEIRELTVEDFERMWEEVQNETE